MGSMTIVLSSELYPGKKGAGASCSLEYQVRVGFWILIERFLALGSSEQNEKWLHNPIKDDPIKGSNTRGTITFANAGPNTRSSQVMIHYDDNSFFDERFAPFGEIIEGREVAEAAHNPTPGSSRGVNQTAYWTEGNDWIRQQYPDINFILVATVDEEKP